MKPFENLVGQTFGRLTVISLQPYIKSMGAKWLCSCECGGQTIAKGNNLKNGNSYSCGCWRKEQMQKIGQNNKKDWGEATTRIIYNNYKCGSKRRNLSFNLTLDQFKDIIFENCIYCGKKPSTLRDHPKCYGFIYYNGIDRKGNNIGYELNNCLTCCDMCNRGKHASSYEEWMKHLNNLVEYRKGKK